MSPPASAGHCRAKRIYWEHEGNRAVASADWKLVAKGERGPWELYDIGQDRSEQHDLAAEQPERVEQLAELWQAWAERAMVLPLNPQAAKPSTRSSKKRSPAR